MLVRSISELCELDHQNDPKHLSTWTADKTPEGVSAWFDNPAFAMLVRTRGTKIVAVGGYSRNGRIDILYVDPTARSAGHSSALLHAMEVALADLGVLKARLTSSKTALAFYQKYGWKIEGADVPCHSVLGHSLAKTL